METKIKEMTDKMIKHEQAKRSVQNLYDPSNNSEKNCLELIDYINQQEQFAKDVARYFELDKQFYDGFFEVLEMDDETFNKIGNEVTKLYEKLTKGVAK